MRIGLLFILLINLGGAWGEDAEVNIEPSARVTPDAQLNYGQSLRFHSRLLGQDVPFNLYLPETFYTASDAHKYPVILIDNTHGEAFFHTLTGTVKHLSGVERMPESIVISLNRGAHTPEIFLRGMWEHTSVKSFAAEGDIDPYLAFLHQEFFPYLAQEYRALDKRTIIGVSTSSRFPLYAFVNAPDMFQHYIFVAAADIMGMGLKEEKSFAQEMIASMQANPQRSGSVYVGVADSDIHKHPKYEDVLLSLRQGLAPFTSLKVKTEVFANEGHYDVFVKTLLSAFELVYPKARWSVKYRDLIAQPGDAMENIDAHYARLSQEYGFDILPRASRYRSVNRLGYIARMLVTQGRIDEAIKVAQRWSQYRPGSIDALMQLVDAYEKKGDLTAALSTLTRALSQASGEQLIALKTKRAKLKAQSAL